MTNLIMFILCTENLSYIFIPKKHANSIQVRVGMGYIPDLILVIFYNKTHSAILDHSVAYATVWWKALQVEIYSIFPALFFCHC